MGLLLGQVSKWRAQRADRGAHAARGFVGGAAIIPRASEETTLVFQCRTRLCGWCSQLLVYEDKHMGGFNAARGFVGGAAFSEGEVYAHVAFQCRTRLCGWCSAFGALSFSGVIDVSMPHAALWVVQPYSATSDSLFVPRFNAARGFVGGAASSLSALVPLRGKRPFGKSPEI